MTGAISLASLRLSTVDQNQTSLIDHVPDDVLLNVFDFYRLAAPSPAKAGITGWTWPWQSLARVCRRWRQLILSSSPKRLRLDFFLTYGAPFASILRLPSEFALELDFPDETYGDDEDNNDPDLADVLVPWAPDSEDSDGVALVFREHPERIRKINLLAHGNDLRKLFAQLTGPTPQLESLEVHAANWPLPLQVFPDNFLEGSAPALRRIELTGVIPPLPSVPNITHFEFYLEHELPEDSSLFNELAEYVRQMSQLETLVIQYDDYEPSPSTDQVEVHVVFSTK
ncbi:hypothetical protein BC834DRAFT_1045939 [Gloeopeniophorella convolvens]|nr:hypothetical protein BC834DRAFT_1045939 [Gloeopeniophorella convolvens]